MRRRPLLGRGIRVARVDINHVDLSEHVPYGARWMLVDSAEGTVFGRFFGSHREASSFTAHVLDRLEPQELNQAKADVRFFTILRDAWRQRFQQSFSISLEDEEELQLADDGRGNWSISYDGPGRVYYRTMPLTATRSKVEEVNGTTSTLLWEEVPTRHLKEYLTRHFFWKVGFLFSEGPLWIWSGGPTPDIPARVCHGGK